MIPKKIEFSNLKDYKYNLYSQNGEDGVIEEINKRLDLDTKSDSRWCVEFGAWDGIYLSNTFKQSKKDRKEIRSTNRSRHPDVYYEHTDAVASSHVELLVLRSEHFHLLNSTFASALRNIYYRRAQWRSSTSKTLVVTGKKSK